MQGKNNKKLSRPVEINNYYSQLLSFRYSLAMSSNLLIPVFPKLLISALFRQGKINPSKISIGRVSIVAEHITTWSFTLKDLTIQIDL